MDTIDFDKEANTMVRMLEPQVSREVYKQVVKAVSDNLLRLAAQAQMTPTSDHDYTAQLIEVLDVN